MRREVNFSVRVSSLEDVSSLLNCANNNGKDYD